MAASYSTIDEVVKVVRQHVDEPTFKAIVRDLNEVDGNQSFRDSIERLNKKVNGRG